MSVRADFRFALALGLRTSALCQGVYPVQELVWVPLAEGCNGPPPPLPPLLPTSPSSSGFFTLLAMSWVGGLYLVVCLERCRFRIFVPRMLNVLVLSCLYCVVVPGNPPSIFRPRASSLFYGWSSEEHRNRRSCVCARTTRLLFGVIPLPGTRTMFCTGCDGVSC